MATYAIGDLQGCYDPLRRLFDYVGFDPAVDRAWFVGDWSIAGRRRSRCCASSSRWDPRRAWCSAITTCIW